LIFADEQKTPSETRHTKKLQEQATEDPQITVVAEKKMFSVYMTGKQMFQRLISDGLAVNSSASGLSATNAFYSPPSWANTPSQSVFVQNFQLWPRAIAYTEVVSAQPALALASDFAASSENSSGTCLN
jgi:hypothetical protein